MLITRFYLPLLIGGREIGMVKELHSFKQLDHTDLRRKVLYKTSSWSARFWIKNINMNYISNIQDVFCEPLSYPILKERM